MKSEKHFSIKFSFYQKGTTLSKNWNGWRGTRNNAPNVPTQFFFLATFEPLCRNWNVYYRLFTVLQCSLIYCLNFNQWTFTIWRNTQEKMHLHEKTFKLTSLTSRQCQWLSSCRLKLRNAKKIPLKWITIISTGRPRTDYANSFHSAKFIIARTYKRNLI